MKSNYVSYQPNTHKPYNVEDYKEKGLTEKDIIELKEVFDEMDMDGNGMISPLELRAALCNFGNLNANMETIHHIIIEYDKDLLGELSFTDFLRIAKEEPDTKDIQDKRNEDIVNMFGEFDSGNKGYLTMEDIIKKGKGIGEKIEIEEAREIFDKCSSDGKIITVEDFYKVMNYGYSTDS